MRIFIEESPPHRGSAIRAHTRVQPENGPGVIAAVVPLAPRVLSGTASLDAALVLAAEGYSVFPCRSNKRPATPNGHKDASCDPLVICGLWRRWPGPLVGIATGAISDLSVLDIDVEGGREWLDRHRERLPLTRAVRTRSGGVHLHFQHREHLRCSAGAIAPGVDVRADGGYAIAWPAAGLPVLRDAPPAPWPDWLLPVKADTRPRESEPPRVPDQKQVSALARFVANSPETQRNTSLYWAACRMAGMVASGMLGGSEAEAVLVAAARYAGLPEPEARRTVLSGLRTGGVA